jgi:hypothetical protein
LLFSDEGDGNVDNYAEEAAVICLATLSPQDSAAVRASGIFRDDDETEFELDGNQIAPDAVTLDLISEPPWVYPGVEIVVSPGIVDGHLWTGTISGSGFAQGEIVRLVPCSATYMTLLEAMTVSCEYDSYKTLGVASAEGEFSSRQLGPVPTDAEGSCLVIGTDSDNNQETNDGEWAVVCTR